MSKRKRKIGIIFGGRSGEHEVSLRSARSVMAALNQDKSEVVPIGITKDGRWLTGNAMAALSDGAASQPATLLPDPQSSTLLQMSSENGLVATEGAASETTLSAVTKLDVIFPVLHGTFGEDGTVQGLLELANIPYIGAGVVGSAVGMDKAIFKNVMVANDIPILPWRLYTRRQWASDPERVISDIETALTYPVFTKPANLGSSVGIQKCDARTELRSGLDEAAQYDRRIVVEQGINVRELEVSVLGNDDPIASVVGEIRPRREFYDYTAKYLTEPGSEEDSELIIPANIDSQLSDEIRTLAVRAYRAIDCAGLARVDLMMDRDNGRLYMNEINTIPGFTSISMYPKLWEATGISYSELLDRLIDLAIERHDEKAGLKRTFGK